MSRRLTSLLLICLCGVCTTAHAGPYDAPASYYASATGTGSTLKGQLTAAMSAGHIQRSYGDFRFSAAITDQDPSNSSNILLVYDRDSVLGVWNTSPLIWNREHVWPVSRQPGSASNSSRGNLGDPHALRPSDVQVNSNRGSEPFGFADTTGSHRSLGTYYYPGDADRGDIARSLFYSDTRWTSSGLSLTDSFPSGNQMGELSSLVAWHYQDVPDEFEQRRNHAIYSSDLNPTYFTNNRNAYIDRPEVVWSVYVDQENDSQIYVGESADANGGSTLEVNLGPMIVGGPAPSAQELMLHKDGFDGSYYEVTTSGLATTSVTGRYNAFAINTTGSDSVPLSVGIDATAALPGLLSGQVLINNLDVTSNGGAGRGANDADDLIDLQLSVLDHATPSFESATFDGTLTVDFGTVAVGDSVPVFDFEIHNIVGFEDFTAGLDFDSIDAVGDVLAFTTDLATFGGASALAAGQSISYHAGFEAAEEGTFSATYTLSFSDEDLPGSEARDDLTLTLLATAEAPVENSADFDTDFDVDGSDFLTWQRGSGITQDADPSQGDANGDGAVDADDLAVWLQQYSEVPGAQFVVVPEPQSALLLLIGIAVVLDLRAKSFCVVRGQSCETSF